MKRGHDSTADVAGTADAAMSVAAPSTIDTFNGPQLAAYTAPRWLPGGQAQTIWPALFSRSMRQGTADRSFFIPPGGRLPQGRGLGALTATPIPALAWMRERWDTPDGDFIDVDRIDPVAPAARVADAASETRPLLVLFHGLEGSSRSHYAQATAQACRLAGWRMAVPHFRGCSGELNRAPRAYHSGDWQEVDWVLRRFRSSHAGPIYAAGISLGGNALLRWAQEAGTQAAAVVQALASVSAPMDLAAGGAAISRGFNRRVYTPMFLRTLKPKALAMVRLHPGLADAQAIATARDLYDFDNAFTAPVHGFRDTDDYWHRASSKPHLASIRLPTLVINARNDPFLPAAALPAAGEVAPGVWLEQPEQGGHVGFAQGPIPGHIAWMPQRLLHFFQQGV
uniref:Putative alpha/beta hydrolase, YheT type n=1 Tax=mine drainage metagenome TaxID=410659 RepID=E6PKW6_9ZZZZ